MNTARVPVPHLQAKIASACLFGIAAVDIGYAWWANKTRGMIDDLAAGTLDLEAFQAHVEWGESLDQISLVGLIIAAIAFISWLYRIVENGNKLSERVGRHAPGAAIYGWLIPVANWFIPYQIVRDSWRSSTPTGESEDSGVGIVSAWWAGWVILSVLGAVLMVQSEPTTPEDLDNYCLTLMARGLMAAVTAVLAFTVVRRLTDRQATRASEASTLAEARIVD